MNRFCIGILAFFISTHFSLANDTFKTQTLVICGEQRIEGINYTIDRDSNVITFDKDSISAQKASYVVDLNTMKARVTLGDRVYDDAKVVSVSNEFISIAYGTFNFGSIDTIFPSGIVVSQFHRMIINYYSTYTMVAKCIID